MKAKVTVPISMPNLVTLARFKSTPEAAEHQSSKRTRTVLVPTLRSI